MLTESSVQPFDSARVAPRHYQHYDTSMTIKGLMLDLDGTSCTLEESL